MADIDKKMYRASVLGGLPALIVLANEDYGALRHALFKYEVPDPKTVEAITYRGVPVVSLQPGHAYLVALERVPMEEIDELEARDPLEIVDIPRSD